MFTKKGMAQNWREVRPYVIFATILFFASIVVGGASDSRVAWLDSMIGSLKDLAQSAADSDHPQQTMFSSIAFNNIYASLMAMFMGIMGGIMPIVTLITNGMMMGYLFKGFADQGENVALLIVKGILPHGILELPALFFACGYGIRLGFQLIKGIFGSLIGRTEPWGGFTLALKGSVPAALLLVVVLLAAALLESTVTYWIMGAS
ncbi:stage II sporulation protein M [Cohnella zeiphila]|uniref:Stage II sporulation protein M n=1 Tax=Cohnella zeiphila TaxID=2761120 RepID=A0A7X0SRZ4_9BACL|nr:stage II sporulation protein M [Cohnella zeiphila]MBB6734989.1 stage II sporulation protein M [Cohnella zeiphila]